MILGIDHIALSCENVEASAARLAQLGLGTKFLETRLLNHPAKRSVLALYEEEHSIAYCMAPGSVPIELTEHSSPLEERLSPYQIMLGSIPPDTVPFGTGARSSWADCWKKALECGEPVAKVWTPFRAQFWHDLNVAANQNGGRVRAAMVVVANLAKGDEFWVKGLGAKAIKRAHQLDTPQWSLLRINSPIPGRSLDIVLCEDDGFIAEPKLDDAGFPCLGLISSDLAGDTDRAVQYGGAPTGPPFPIKVDGKQLDVAVLRGPSNELVEIIQVQRA